MKSFAFCLLCLSTAASLQAATWVVDNDESRPANFRTAQAAHDAAAAGDTLLFVGSGVSYNDLIMSKPLHLVGPGYHFVQNGIPFANGAEVIFNYMQVKSPDTPGGGASGSTLKGIRGNNLSAEGVSNVDVDQCRFNSIDLSPAGTGVLHFGTGFTVRRSYFRGFKSIAGSAVIHNCYGIMIWAETHANHGASVSIFQTNITGLEGGEVAATLPSRVSLSNCIVHCGVAVSNAVTVAGSVIFINAANFQGNRAATDLTQVYRVAFSPDAGRDADFRLNTDPSNPAIGAGVGGGDAGMFAGAQPYQLSGIPARPRVTHLSTSGVVSDTVGLSVQAGGEIRP